MRSTGSDEFQRAMEAYLEAAESGDPEWQSQAWYNLGNALMRQQQPGPAAEAYKEALRRDPLDQDAKHNLELALGMLPATGAAAGGRRRGRRAGRAGRGPAGAGRRGG